MRPSHKLIFKTQCTDNFCGAGNQTDNTVWCDHHENLMRKRQWSVSCFVDSKMQNRSSRKVRQRRTSRDHVPQIQALTGHSCIFVNLVANLPRGTSSRSGKVLCQARSSRLCSDKEAEADDPDEHFLHAEETRPQSGENHTGRPDHLPESQLAPTPPTKKSRQGVHSSECCSGGLFSVGVGTGGLSHEWWALGKERIITCEESIECRRVVVVLPPNSSVKRC